MLRSTLTSPHCVISHRKVPSSWIKTWPDATGGNAQSVACGVDGSVYIAGTANRSTGNLDDILIAKFSADGDTLWGRTYDGPLHRYDEGIDITVDNAGNAYVVGRVKDTTGNPDVIVLGGGMSNIARLYRHVPLLWGRYVFSDSVTTRLASCAVAALIAQARRESARKAVAA